MIRPQILVVEDDPEIVAILQRMLAPTAFDVTVCTTLPEVLEAVERAVLVVCDLNLLGTSGLDILKGIRRSGATVPVLMMSGDSRRETIRDCIAAGADGFIGKPFQRQQLASRVVVLLKAHPPVLEPQSSL